MEPARARPAGDASPAPGSRGVPYRLPVGVFVDRVQRLVATVARLLEPAEWHRHVAPVEAVHPNHAGADRLSRALRLSNVVRPYPGGEAVNGIVGDGQRLVQGPGTRSSTGPARRSPPARSSC